MKKILSLLFIVIMVLPLSACGEKKSGTMVIKSPETVTNPVVSITDGAELELKRGLFFL